LIILRSIGKFFGLAGLRLGFVAAAPCWLKQLSYLLGPWSVNGPAQYIGQQALSELSWQKTQRSTLKTLSDKLAIMLMEHFKVKPTGSILFKTIQHNNAPQIFKALCQQGVYVRLCDEKNALRFGIATSEQFDRLEKVLKLVIPITINK
jgi:cobalamin biosynthetic protein CobC